MKKKQLSMLYSVFIFLFLLTSNYAQIAVDANIKQNQDRSLVISGSQNPMSAPDYIIEMLNNRQNFESMEESDTVSTISDLETSSLDPMNPVFEELEITIHEDEDYSLESDLGGTHELIPPIPDNKIKRGATVTVTGRLWGGITGRYWDNEMVYLYYSITEAEYEGNQAFYFGNGQYEVSSDLTDIDGIFSIDLVTSILSSSDFSKVGDINLLTWFNGSSAERLAGSPGAKNVTFFGQMDINNIASVTNPSNPYSFTTSIVFENGTTVKTFGTNYDLVVDWSVSNGFDHSSTNAFTVSHQHSYGTTAPGPAEETVYYSASYNIAQLGINFFIENSTGFIVTIEDYTINTVNVPYTTEESLVVDAYFDFTGTYLKGPQEIQMGSTIDFYANLSFSGGLVNGSDIDIYILYGTTPTYSHSNTTVAGAISFSLYFDPTVYTDITQGISIQFRFYESTYYPARFLNDSLSTILAVDISTVTLTLDDSSIFYTTSMSLGFNVEVRDVNNNLARLSRFQLIFPGIGTEEIVTATGSEDVSKIVPSYVILNDFETIIITALFEDGGHYKYYVPGSPSDSDSFDIYHSLTLILYYPNATVVSTASTNEWNQTYWPQFSAGYYELTAVDQSGRNPIGAEISISFAGSTMNAYITVGVNYVRWGSASLVNASFETWEAYVGDLIATGGSMPTPPSIILSVNVFGPDNAFPTIDDIILTPDPFILIPHDPYYNITVTVIASDIGTGVRTVNLTYGVFDFTDTLVYWDILIMSNIGPNTYQANITTFLIHDQYLVRFALEVNDYNGYGINAVGGLQTNPIFWYDQWAANYYLFPLVPEFRVGDVYGPVEDSPPLFNPSSDPLDPSVDITVYMNDSIVYSGMNDVIIAVHRNNTITGVLELFFVNNESMTNILGTNQWTYALDMDYNYEYWVFYLGFDTASPGNNPTPTGFYGPVYLQAIDSTAPSISAITPIYNGTIASPDTVITYNVTISDTQTNISSVVLSIDITLGETVYVEDYTIIMTRVGTSDVFTAQLDLSDFALTRSGTYALLYSVTATDEVGNFDTISASMGILNEAGGLGISNLGAIIGGVVGGIVVLLAGLFLWFNRHTIQTYTKKQTFKRRLRDYLREIIEDIKKDGLEGRYKEGILKSWSVVEGIGREFFNLPRYRSQTPTEFGRLLTYRGKIESELINTLLLYFEKARYGHEEITEKDFNAGIRALLKLVDKIEVGEMKIES